MRAPRTEHRIEQNGQNRTESDLEHLEHNHTDRTEHNVIHTESTRHSTRASRLEQSNETRTADHASYHITMIIIYEINIMRVVSPSSLAYITECTCDVDIQHACTIRMEHSTMLHCTYTFPTQLPLSPLSLNFLFLCDIGMRVRGRDRNLAPSSVVST